MSIRIEQPGLSTLYGKLATLAGQAEAGRRQQQMAVEVAERTRSREHELATMQMRAEYEIEGERRSHEWELEKAEIASRNDFMEEERKRLTKHQEYDAAMKAIDKADNLTPKEKSDFKLQYELRERTGFAPESRVMFPEAYQRDVTESQNITQLDKFTGILSDFQENADINRGWGTKIVPLAILDKEGKPVREATPEEITLYRRTKQAVSDLGTPQTAPGAPTAPVVSTPGLPPKPAEYPDAVWNPTYKMWTVIRDGRLKGIK